MGSSRWLRYLICFALSAALVIVYFVVVSVNATTVALTMLLLVLGVATKWGLGEGVFTSVLCVFAFNFFFLPPIGTLTIADPQNWVALTAFLVSAVIASQLSAKAKHRADEALARRSELERLYKLSRAMLMDEESDLTRSTLLPIRDIFGLSQVMFYDAEAHDVEAAGPDAVHSPELEHVTQTGEKQENAGTVYLPVRLGTRVVGGLSLAGAKLSAPEQESIANLVAIGYERIRAVKRAAEAEAARQGERLKKFVLDGIAHDLKTPLTAIKTCVTTLITIPPQSEEKRTELLAIIDEETHRLHTTISEAIQLARIESAKIGLQRARVQLLEIVERISTGVDERHPIHLKIPAGLEVSADPELLVQALRQLIENAVKYSKPNEPIEIDADATEATVTIKVADRGPGISPPELERIFDKFYRGTRGRSASQGSGMGLAIARGIIDAHGGRVWAENRPGGGAVFIVQLSKT